MIGEKKLFSKLEKVLARSKADETEIIYFGDMNCLTRFANSYIHQNISVKNSLIYFRVVKDKRVGVASTNSIRELDLKQTLENALEIARQQPEKPDFPGLPKPQKYKTVLTFDEYTASFTPKQRAMKVKQIIRKSSEKNFTLAGAFSTGFGEIAVVNSHGLKAYQPVTFASTNMVVMSDDSSGYASDTSRNVADLDFDNMANRAIEKCFRSQNPIEIKPGKYEVILEPAAVAEILEWLNYIGLGSKPFQQQMSFLSGKIGKKITSGKISIYDDGYKLNGVPFPFDFEGVPKKKVMFIDKGVANGVVYDSVAAAKDKTKSTGHAVTPNYAHEGASGLNIYMAPGKKSLKNMIADVKKGILVTRFHYINGFIDTRNSVLTGMTRDGTFLVEDGEIKNGIKNLRFTDSMMSAFKTTQSLSKETGRVSSWWSALGCMTVPAVHLKKFNFSGKTDF